MEKIMRQSYLFTGDKKLCSGCRACEFICSSCAIEMREDDEGFLFPYIDLNKCVDCGLCDRICPMNPAKTKLEIKDYKQRCFGGWPKVKGIKLAQKSATIGFSTMIARYILQCGGVVYGVKLNNEINGALHIRITTSDELILMQNSKYIQSDTGNTFLSVRKDLQDDKLVYYTGTPCQIAGLKAFLRKDYDNLLTTDLVCHGVCSKKMYREELNFWGEKYKSEISDFRFRGKGIFPYVIGGLVNFQIKTRCLGFKRRIYVPAAYSPLYYSYAYAKDSVNYNLRLSCYNCRFRNMERMGDISIGDFHGASKYHNVNFAMRQFGLSLILINSRKGESIFNELKEQINFFETEMDKAAVQPALLMEKREIPDKRKMIYDNLGVLPYKQLVHKYIFSENYFKTKNVSVLKYLIKYYLVTVLCCLHIKR